MGIPAASSAAFVRSPKFWAAAVLGLSFGLRTALSLTADGLSGIDAGAYLNHALGLIGHGSPGLDITRPPLAPGWLLVPFIELLGNVAGYNLFSAVFSMLLPITLTAIAWRLFSPWRALLVAVFACIDPFALGMMVTGVLPLVGSALIVIASYCMWETSEKGLSWKRGIGLAVSLGLIAFVNQTSAGLAVMVIPLQWALLRNRKALVLPLAVGALLAASALPWYLGAAPTDGRLTYPGPLVLPHNLWEHQLWVGIGVLALAHRVARSEAFRQAAQPLRMCLYLVTFLGCLQMFQSFNEVVMNLFFRATYLMTPFLWLLLAWMAPPQLLESVMNTRMRLAAAFSLVLLVGVTAVQVREQQELSGYGVRAVLATASFIDHGTVVTNSQATAFVIGAWTESGVYWSHYIEPPPAFRESDAIARCAFGWLEGCSLPPDVSYVLVDTRLPFDAYGIAPRELLTPYGAPERKPWGSLDQAPWLALVHESGPVKLYEVRHG